MWTRCGREWVARAGRVETPAARGSRRDNEYLQVATDSVRQTHWVDSAMLLACKAGWMGSGIQTKT